MVEFISVWSHLLLGIIWYATTINFQPDLTYKTKIIK